MTARIRTVNVVHALRPGRWHETAIDKRPVRGRVEVGALGLAGDQQVDPTHGGTDRAVYVYADEDAEYWAERLDRKIPPGLFGENLRTTGLEVTGALIGQRWKVGDLVLEVRRPRTPCENLAQRMGIEGFHLAFNDSGRTGAMCRVVEPGSVSAGDAILGLPEPQHEVTVAAVATGSATSQQWQALLDAGLPLAAQVRNKARRAVRATRV